MDTMDRRTVLTLGVTPAAASPLAAGGAMAEPAPAAPAVMKGLPDVTVVGAGAFGAWTALWQRESSTSGGMCAWAAMRR
jgi:hypothetical protein